MVDLSSLDGGQKREWKQKMALWTSQAQAIVNSVGSNATIEEIQSARDQVALIPCAWAKPLFLEELYTTTEIRRKIGRRVCQWCFNDSGASERCGDLLIYYIAISFVINGSPGTITGAYIRLCPKDYRELKGGKLRGIQARIFDYDPGFITLTWDSDDLVITQTPINPRLVIGGHLRDTLNPQELSVRNVNKQVIWTPDPDSITA